mgnify:CR=1 FL=1
MPLIPLRPLLETVDKYHYAQGAFNVNAVAQAKAAIEVHEMFRSAAILQGADLANGFMGGRTDFQNATLEDKKIGAKNIANAVKKYAEDSPIPVVLHLDHGKNFDSCKAAIEGGYTSVMIDGSSLPFDENVELTREVVKYAHERGVSVEGELGVLAGVEDHVFSATSTYTNPLKAVEFFKKTGVDALAISYGTMHGASKGKNVKLRKEIVIAIKECMMHEGIFGVLVSHGSSTVPKYIVDEINALGGNIQNAHGISVDELKACRAQLPAAACGQDLVPVRGSGPPQRAGQGRGLRPDRGCAAGGVCAFYQRPGAGGYGAQGHPGRCARAGEQEYAHGTVAGAGRGIWIETVYPAKEMISPRGKSF